MEIGMAAGEPAWPQLGLEASLRDVLGLRGQAGGVWKLGF